MIKAFLERQKTDLFVVSHSPGSWTIPSETLALFKTLLDVAIDLAKEDESGDIRRGRLRAMWVGPGVEESASEYRG